MKSFKILQDEIMKLTKKLEVETKEKIEKEIRDVENQEEFLYEFLYNLVEFTDIQKIDGTQLFFLTNLFSDALQNSRTVKKLTIKGQYSAAGALLRNMFETMLLMDKLHKDPNNWKEWFECQTLNEAEREAPLKKKSKRLRELIHKFSTSSLMNEILDLKIKSNYKWNYGYLCSFPHTSMERIRRVTTTTTEGYFYLDYAPKFNFDVAVYCLRTLFILIDSIYDTFVSSLKPEIKGPLEKYKKIRPTSQLL